MQTLVFAFLVTVQVMFPLPGGRTEAQAGPGSTRLPDQSLIEGEVKTKEGVPVPLANISVQTRQDARRADQRGDGVGWPGTVVKVRRDGTYRVRVPGDTTYEVCAEVPAKAKQCRLVEVSVNDVQVVMFAF